MFIFGGRCAEELFFNEITTGASDDIQRAYEIARNMVIKYGMSEKVGLRHFEEGGVFNIGYSLDCQALQPADSGFDRRSGRRHHQRGTGKSSESGEGEKGTGDVAV